MSSLGHRLRGAVLAAAFALPAFTVAPAHAWDPATTQAGLTERALLGSSFHRVLAQRLGKSLGAFEPLALHSRLLPPDLRQTLWARLAALDPAGGYRPDPDGVQTAIAWVTAGAVLAETPPERGRHHFFDPRTGRGLDDKGGLAGTALALRLAIDAGGTVRDLATGTAFDATGQPSLRWVRAPENDLGLPVFDAHIERAVSAAEPVEREAALTRALLALGGVLAALEDAGEPAHVRNDFRATFLERQGPSGWDRGSEFERFVAHHFGRSGVPAGKPVTRPSFDAFFTHADGSGLADRTQRGFFSEGTIPDEVPVDAATTPQEVLESARADLRYPQPSIGRLELRGPPARRYVMVEGRRALAYVREPEGVRFFLDAGVYTDAARALLPEVVGYAGGLVDHLFRGSVGFAFEGGNVTLTLDGLRGDKAEGTLSVYAEDETGRRRPVLAQGLGSARTIAVGDATVVAVPAGARRIGVVFRGSDAAGDLVVVGDVPVR